MKMLSKRLFGLSVLLAIVMSGCGLTTPIGKEQRLNLNLEGKNARPFYLLRDAAGDVAVALSHIQLPRLSEDHQVFIYTRQDGTWVRARFERADPCVAQPRYVRVTRRPDGKLGVIGICAPLNSKPEDRSAYLLEHDERTGKTAITFGRPLPIDESYTPSYNPSGDRVLVSFGTLFSGIYWFDATGGHPITATITAGGKRFVMTDAYTAYGTDAAYATGNADAPDWSPDGTQIVFRASADAINQSGFARYQGEWQVYLMPVATLEPRAIVSSLYNPGAVLWAPDGRHIAFLAERGISRDGEIWTYAIADGSVRLVARGEFNDILWAKDSKAIYALKDVAQRNEPFVPNEFWRYDLP